MVITFDGVTPRFEVIQVTPNRFQVNEVWPTHTVFVGLRETEDEAIETVAKLHREYRSK